MGQCLMPKRGYWVAMSPCQHGINDPDHVLTWLANKAIFPRQRSHPIRIDIKANALSYSIFPLITLEIEAQNSTEHNVQVRLQETPRLPSRRTKPLVRPTMLEDILGSPADLFSAYSSYTDFV